MGEPRAAVGVENKVSEDKRKTDRRQADRRVSALPHDTLTAEEKQSLDMILYREYLAMDRRARQRRSGADRRSEWWL